jgi:branched-chain amino acid transport system substrate-binding protein
MKLRKLAAALATCGLLAAAGTAQAQKLSGDKIVIGFITDMSSLYSDIDGAGGVEAIKMAIADMQKEFPGKKIELVFADHQNKADIASSKVREWIDQAGADVIIGGTNSSTALASAKVAAEKKRPYISVGAATSRLTNEDCTPYTVHYAYDTVALANGTGAAVVKSGGKSWYFLTADYAFGHSLEKDTGDVVKAAGGTVVGAVRHPL